MKSWMHTLYTLGVLLFMIISLTDENQQTHAEEPQVIPITMQKLLAIPLEPGEYVMVNTECRGWGIGFTGTTISNNECRDICCYYRLVDNNQVELDRCVECGQGM